MSEADTTSVADADLHVRANFDKITRSYLLSVLSDALIEEHRRKPEGHHSEPLTRLLNWCQTRPLHEQYAVLQEAGGCYRVVRLSGKPRVPPARVGSESYASLREARHAVFLNHIKDLTGK
ncbi:hypothetical protein G5B31_05780 [Rhodobacter sp. SGA-6-6]|uniref:hypothetical protein n=1 Tax=Rhodobacter sp. SGA-6-6 TaxID=2710882 RepID=UPI0013EB4AE9|nr:hypothetical protein [Rhodobacter sp. SGA-6-6]NGM45044.1 hypothetical protein [Rhodobacter sp. SGA-6-6]